MTEDPNGRRWRTISLRASASLAMLLANPCTAQSAPAQDAPAPAAPTQAEAAPQDDGSILTRDIIVTANRRDENLQRVGISVTAFGGEQMQKLGFTSTTDIVKQTPSVTVYQFSPGVSNINIRGVVQNDFTDHLEPPIAVYQDDSYVGNTGAIAVPMYDMQRVEVLRGPQGTLFGRNATGGLIHFISAPPTEHFSGYAQGSYGSFDSWNLQGAVSGPITENVLGRLSFSRSKGESPVYNRVTGRRDAGDTDSYAVRGQLLFKLGENTELRLLGRYNNDDAYGPGYSTGVAAPGPDGLGRAVGPTQIATYPNIVTGGTVTASCAGCNVYGYRDRDGNPWRSDANHPGFFKRDIYDGQAKLTHDFGGVTLTAITDYLEVNKNAELDNDSSPQQFFSYSEAQRYHQVSQEIRLAGESDRLKWVAGGYYLKMSGRYGVGVDLDLAPYVGAPLCTGVACPLGGTVPARFRANYSLRTTSYAGFAQGEFELGSSLSLTAGARFTHDKKRYDYAFANTPVIQPNFTYNPGNSPDADRSFDNVSAKLGLDYKPDSATLVYASITRGHKGGNWTAPVFPPIDPSVFDHKQEVLTSYEVGVKKRFLNGLATFNASAFYYDYHDYQAFSLINITQTITNVDATVYGGEAELKLSPVRGLDLGLNASTVHSTVKDIVLPNGQRVDRKLPNTPGIALSGLARYSFDFAGGSLATQASGQYRSGYYLTVLNEPVNREPRWATLDLRLSWTTADDRLELAVYGDNVTSTRYRVWALDVSALSLAMQVYAPPATYGASARFRF